MAYQMERADPIVEDVRNMGKGITNVMAWGHVLICAQWAVVRASIIQQITQTPDDIE